MEKRKKINYILLNCVLFAGLLIIIVAYLIQVNITVSYSIEMKKNDTQLDNLQAENEHLLQQVTTLGAIGNVYAVSQNLNMVETENIDYITPPQETLAEKN